MYMMGGSEEHQRDFKKYGSASKLRGAENIYSISSLFYFKRSFCCYCTCSTYVMFLVSVSALWNEDISCRGSPPRHVVVYARTYPRGNWQTSFAKGMRRGMRLVVCFCVVHYRGASVGARVLLGLAGSRGFRRCGMRVVLYAIVWRAMAWIFFLAPKRHVSWIVMTYVLHFS